MRALRPLLAVSTLLFAACGGSNPTSGTNGSSSGGSSGSSSGGMPLDCGWLNGNNCYKDSLAAAQSCLPPQDALGLFNAAATSCTYDGGDTITFASPETYPAPSMLVLSFTVSLPDGGLCMRYADEANSAGFTLQTSAGTLTESNTTSSATVVCPDGTTFYNGDAFNLINCDGGFLSLPGRDYSFSPIDAGAGTPFGNLSASLNGTADGQPLPVFSCFAP